MNPSLASLTIHYCSSKPSIIIEYGVLANRNLSYIKSLFVHLQLDPNNIMDYSFRSLIEIKYSMIIVKIEIKYMVY